MSRAFGENIGLKLFALLLAVGIVWIKAQDKINRRNLSDVQIVVDNVPENFSLPSDPWISPTVNVAIQGPRNTVEFVRSSQFSFHIDLAKITLSGMESPINVLLTHDMFKMNLPEEDRLRISVVEGSIYPSQVTFSILPWNIDQEKPSLTNLEFPSNQKVIPLFRIEKLVPLAVPHGTLPDDVVLKQLSVDPADILITGSMDAVQRIQSVSTTILDFSSIPADARPVFLHLQGLGRGFDIQPVPDTIRGATVFYEIQQKKR
ncbi:MAG: hypothetical protein C4527_12005 [Candidatus Omnitrophota bacterium]|jgi:YbbR domain-containing protein|nr:MAG: hypothetical protein C4527_12005 [Candidatus Omnitrophota bacterium]